MSSSTALCPSKCEKFAPRKSKQTKYILRCASPNSILTTCFEWVKSGLTVLHCPKSCETRWIDSFSVWLIKSHKCDHCFNDLAVVTIRIMTVQEFVCQVTSVFYYIFHCLSSIKCEQKIYSFEIIILATVFTGYQHICICITTCRTLIVICLPSPTSQFTPLAASYCINEQTCAPFKAWSTPSGLRAMKDSYVWVCSQYTN